MAPSSWRKNCMKEYERLCKLSNPFTECLMGMISGNYRSSMLREYSNFRIAKPGIQDQTYHITNVNECVRSFLIIVFPEAILQNTILIIPKKILPELVNGKNKFAFGNPNDDAILKNFTFTMPEETEAFAQIIRQHNENAWRAIFA